MSDEPLTLDMATLRRLAEIAEPHGHALLDAVRAEFGDDKAATLHPLALFMLSGAMLKVIPNADRAPDGVALVWQVMGVPFSLEPKRTQ